MQLEETVKKKKNIRHDVTLSLISLSEIKFKIFPIFQGFKKF